jgi:hypothetical protein
MFEHLSIEGEGDTSFVAAMITSRRLLVLALAFALRERPPERVLALDLGLGCPWLPPDVYAYERLGPPKPPVASCRRYREEESPSCAEGCHNR